MLKDALDRALTFMPRYLQAVGAILSRPVREVSERAVLPEAVPDALAFWLISQVLGHAARYIALNARTDQVIYFAGNLLASGASLTMTSVCAIWAWRLVGRPFPPGAALAAVAYTWAAITPILAVLSVMTLGLTRLVSEEAFRHAGRAQLGCIGLIDVDRVMTERAAAPDWVVVAQNGLDLAGLVLLAVYFVAFLWISARLSGARGVRLAGGFGAFSVLLVLATALSVLFHQSLLQGIGECAIG